MSNAPAKISATFAARMKAGGARARVRALLLLASPTGSASGGSTLRATTRRKTAGAVREAASAVLPLVDAILLKHHGKRLSDRPDALGSVSIEAPPAGIMELARQTWTRAVMEDQRVVCSGRD